MATLTGARRSPRPARRGVRFAYHGQLLTVLELARLSGLHTSTINGRLRSGWTVEKAVETKANTPGRLDGPGVGPTTVPDVREERNAMMALARAGKPEGVAYLRKIRLTHFHVPDGRGGLRDLMATRTEGPSGEQRCRLSRGSPGGAA